MSVEDISKKASTTLGQKILFLFPLIQFTICVFVHKKVYHHYIKGLLNLLILLFDFEQEYYLFYF